MSKNDIVITLFTIVYGLMLADLFSSFHKLFRAGKTVKWHWLPVLSAWYLFLTILNNWWNLFPVSGGGAMNIFLFVAYGHWLFLTFLLVSAALPDVIDENGMDLKKYYFENHRYFWGLMSAVVIVSILLNFRQLDQINIYQLPALAILPGLTITLACSKKYWVHSTILVILFIGIFFELAR